MKYKLLACDIDGTLLTSKHQLTQRTRKVILEAKDKGVLVTLATGRNFASAQYIAKQLKINIPIIANDGSFVIDPCGSFSHYDSRIEGEVAIRVIDLLNQFNANYIIQDDPNIYLNNRMIWIHMMKSVNIFMLWSLWKEVQHHRIMKHKVLRKKIYSNEIRPFKIGVFEDDVHLLDEISKRIGKEFKGNLKISNSGFKGIEIVQNGYSKATGLNFLCKQFKIDHSEVMAIGDSFNDIEMIGFAGLGIAMGNASEDLKEHAQYVTRSNDEDGVAFALEQFVL